MMRYNRSKEWSIHSVVGGQKQRSRITVDLAEYKHDDFGLSDWSAFCRIDQRREWFLIWSSCTWPFRNLENHESESTRWTAGWKGNLQDTFSEIWLPSSQSTKGCIRNGPTMKGLNHPGDVLGHLIPSCYLPRWALDGRDLGEEMDQDCQSHRSYRIHWSGQAFDDS